MNYWVSFRKIFLNLLEISLELNSTLYFGSRNACTCTILKDLLKWCISSMSCNVNIFFRLYSWSWEAKRIQLVPRIFGKNLEIYYVPCSYFLVGVRIPLLSLLLLRYTWFIFYWFVFYRMYYIFLERYSFFSPCKFSWCKLWSGLQVWLNTY